MNRRWNINWTVISAVAGFIGVALGAFGAHGLKHLVTPELLASFETGVRYHMIHAVVLLVLARRENLNSARILILIGIILFSSSLYIYALTGMRSIVTITPIGGFFLLAGWLMIIPGELKKKAQRTNL